jgi:hypothetical protein
VEGENVPFVEFVIPVPLQTPPEGFADKLNAEPLLHTGETELIDAGDGVEVTTC